MRPRRRRVVRLLIAIGLAASLLGCGDDAPEADGDTGAALPVGDLTIGPGELVWAVGSTLHVGRRTEDVGRRIDGFVVGPRGIYYQSRGALWFTDLDRDERVVERLGFTHPVLSPSGRYVGFLDFSTVPASAVAFDLDTGRETARDDSGMGNADDDLADLYEDAEPTFLGFDDAAAYNAGTDGVVYRIPLDGSDVSVQRRHLGMRRGLPILPPPGQGRLLHHGLGGELAPDGTAKLLNVLNLRFTPRAVGGGALDLALGRDRNRFAIAGWLDGHRVWGAAGRSRSVSLGRTASLVECDLRPGGRCRDLSRPFAVPDHAIVVFDGRTGF